MTKTANFFVAVLILCVTSAPVRAQELVVGYSVLAVSVPSYG